MIISHLILAAGDDNTEKIIGAVIFIAIWVISAIASWVNKQKEQERRRKLREQLEQLPKARPTPVQMRPTPPVQQRPRIAQGLATRYPDVLKPPAPAPRPAA